MTYPMTADLQEALRSAIRIAGEAADEWDKAPNGMRAGKILLALAGLRKGYRADIDAIHEALTRSPAEGEGVVVPRERMIAWRDWLVSAAKCGDNCPVCTFDISGFIAEVEAALTQAEAEEGAKA